MFDPKTLDDVKTPSKSFSGRIPLVDDRLSVGKFSSTKSHKEKKNDIK